MKYYGEIKDDYSIVTKKYVDNTLSNNLENVSNFYLRTSVEEMEKINNAQHGDFCVIFSNGMSAQNIYCYFTKNASGELIEPKWEWITELGLTSVQSVLLLENGDWDYSLGSLAKINLEADTTINITNVTSGSFGAIDVYGNYDLTLPSNSYSFPPDWDYLIPNSNQHYRYSFYYDGNKFDWNRSVRENE